MSVYKRIALVVTVGLLCLTLLPHATVGASALYPTCDNSILEGFDWPGLIKASTSNTPNSGAGLTSFDPSTSSYFMYQTTTNHSALRNVYNIIIGTASNKMTADVVSGTPGIYYNGTINVNVNIIAEPTSQKAPSQSWAGTPGGSWTGFNDGTFALAGSTTSSSPFALSSIYCIAGSKNIALSPGWTYDSLPGGVDYTSGVGLTGATACGALDLSCWVAKGFKGVANTLLDVAKAIVGAFATLFLPDSTQLQTDFNSFSSFMSAKLGFLVYPVTFFGNVFSALGGTSNNWCTSSGCTKTFGTFWGHTFSINILAVSTVYSTVWTWFLALVRGLLILSLLYAVKRTYERQILDK